MIDLRSDTVTRPTPAMREAMAGAEVGDDIYGEDPTVARLEAYVAERLGKETALFVPSGTMANQIGLSLHAQAGDEVLTSGGAHVALYESGAAAGLAGLQLTPVVPLGIFDVDALAEVLRPDDYYRPRQATLAIENTHNQAGGLVWPQDVVVAVAARAREHGLRVHLDGARLWNASVASGRDLAELAAPADTVSVCFSKGLGAPVGSAIACAAADRPRAMRLRRRLGGAMRQSGILAAAALHALEHHMDDLADDHRRARRLAEGLRDAGFGCDVDAVETNIVPFDVPKDASEWLADAKQRGVLLGAIGPQRIRAVTHRDLDDAAIDEALKVLGPLSAA